MSEDDKKTASGGKLFPSFDADSVQPYIVKDPEAMAMNFARTLENLGKAASAWLAPRERGERVDPVADPATDMIKTMSRVSEYWMSDPKRALEAQTQLIGSFFNVWTRSLSRMSGEAAADETVKKEKRFADEDWQRNPFFDFLRQVYVTTSDWAEKMVEEAEGLDPHTRHKATFYVKQIMAALSPANFVATNPELYRETVASSGANLVKGMALLAEDIRAGGGELRLRQTDATKFAIGINIALTPGKVIAQSDVCQVIQYEPATDKVLKRPLMICPPWINKFYILDLNPQKSFIKWCVDQGHTVFVISWVNPDERHRDKDWTAYACTLAYYDYRLTFDAATHARIRSCLEDAVARFPTYATAWALLSLIYIDELRYRFPPETSGGAAPIEKARAAARTAVSLDPTNIRGREAEMFSLYFSGDKDAAIEVGKAALELNPNDTQLMGEYGYRLALSGEWEAGCALVDEARKRQPGRAGYYETALGLCAYQRGDYATAAIWIRKVPMTDNPQYHAIATVIFAELGDPQVAAEVEWLRVHAPQYFQDARSEIAYRIGRKQDVDRILASLKKAGIPAKDH